MPTPDRDPSPSPPPVWTPVPCMLCGADEPERLLVDRVPSAGGGSWDFPVLRCGRCGFVYVSPRGSGRVFNNLSGGAARRDAARANRPIYEAGLGRLRRLGLPEGAAALDLGCARGDFLAFARGHGLTPVGVDLHPGLAQEARARGFEVVTGDLRDPAVAEGLGGRFDLVTLWDVIEHVDDPVAVLAACARALRPGGLVLFHTGNARFQVPKARLLGRLRPGGGPFLIPYQHLSHFNPATARMALARAGLEPLWAGSLGTLRYRQAWKWALLGGWNAVAAAAHGLGLPLMSSAMGAIARRT